MSCIKTGFHGYVRAYSEYIRGDAFACDAELFERQNLGIPRKNSDLKRILFHNGLGIQPIYYFRISQRSFEPLHSKLHFVINTYDEWFDRGDSHPATHKNYSTMIATNVTNHGYEGINLKEAFSAPA